MLSAFCQISIVLSIPLIKDNIPIIRRNHSHPFHKECQRESGRQDRNHETTEYIVCDNCYVVLN